MAGHSVCKLLVIVFTILCFLGMITMNVFFAFDADEWDIGIFENTVDNISDKYPVEITPADWTFAIWGAIYIYLVLMFIYILSLFCRSADAGFLYYQPGFLNYGFFLFLIINFGLNVAWLFMWDEEELELASAFLFGVAVSLYCAIGIAAGGVNAHASELIKQNHAAEIPLVVSFVLNCLGLYAGWATVASWVNFNIVLVYELDIAYADASTICLCCLAFLIVLYGIVEFVFFEPHFRFVFTPYIALGVGLAGILEKNWDDENQNMILTVGIAAITGLLLLVKVGNACVKERRNPLRDIYQA